MKKTKILSIILAAILLLIPMSTTALAVDMDYYAALAGIDLESVLGGLSGIFSGNNNGDTSVDLNDFLSDPSVITNALSGLLGGVSTDDLATAITTILGGQGEMSMEQLLEEVIKSIGAFEETTTSETTTQEETTTLPPETTTEEQTTVEIEATTAPPTTEPSTTAPVYTPSTPTYTPSTQAPETTTYTYIPPEIITAEPLTGETYNAVIYDDNASSSDGVTVKMALGIVILVLSGAAVIVVAFVLKKSRV